MSSELAKGLLVASCVLVIVSAGFMMFSTPSSADMVGLDVYLKCQACGDVKSFTLDDFAIFARKQFDELKIADPDLVNDIMNDFAQAPAESEMPVDPATVTDAEIERRIIAAWGDMTEDLPAKCEACGKYASYRALNCRKCNEIFIIETLLDKVSMTCPKCRGKQ
ncbi:MAG: hypothetical protein JXD22_15605 [Sedimentisphaerales bacterium]|nr:hypothetical protein [Sedimentisphaerales bacterium]